MKTENKNKSQFKIINTIILYIKNIKITLVVREIWLKLIYLGCFLSIYLEAKFTYSNKV